MSDYDVIVIGAGLGGLSSGALLAESGRRVLVLEQAGQVGGCCSTFEEAGYRFDVGASIVEIIQPIEEVFRRLRTTFQKEVDLIACDPIMSVINRDGTRITYPLSIEKTGEIISGIDAADGRRWLDFVDFASELMDVTLNCFFCEPANNLGDMLAMVRKDPRLLKYLPTFLSSYQDVLQRFFKDERVLRTMGYQALYFGHPPALVPGPFAMVPYSEHRGIYYPRGGMIRIPEALQRCGERFGMQVRLNTRVERVLVRGGKVAGIALADGQEISAPVVVSNINAKTLYQEMIGDGDLPPAVRRGIRSYAYSTACPMVYVGLDCPPPLEAHHSLVGLTPEEVNQYWWNNVEKGILPDEHFALICWPSHSDDTLAPAGKHVLNIIPEGFYHLANSDWDREKPHYLERILDFAADLFMPDMAKHITVMDCATPLDFERRLRLPHGAIYSLQQDLTAQAVFRPAARSKSIQGLYLAGSSTHPGGGVPTTIASGLIAANLIGQDN